MTKSDRMGFTVIDAHSEGPFHFSRVIIAVRKENSRSAIEALPRVIPFLTNGEDCSDTFNAVAAYCFAASAHPIASYSIANVRYRS